MMITQVDIYYIILHFKKYYKLIAIDLNEQQKLDADPKSIQKINVNGNLDRAESSKMCSSIDKAKDFLFFKYYNVISF